MRVKREEIAYLRARYRERKLEILRKIFCAENESEDQRGYYFDSWIASAEHLQGISDDDILCLLEIGFTQNMALTKTYEYTTCVQRKRWYGRRLWLRDRLDQVKELNHQV